MTKNLIKKKYISIPLAILCTFMWGLAIPLLKLGYKSMEIVTSNGNVGTQLLYAGVRFVLAGIIVYVILSGSQKRLVLPQKSSLLPYLLLGLVQTFGQYIFYYIGIGNTNGVNTSLITSCTSFLTVLFAPIFFKGDKLTVPKIIGCALGFIGILTVTGGIQLNLANLLGDGLILFATICSASGNIISKKITFGKNPMEVTAFQLTLGGTLLTFFGIIFGGTLEFKNIASILYLAVLAIISAVAFTIWSALLKHHPASRISVFNLLIPVFGTVLSGILLGDDIFRIEILVSLIFIILGIALVNITFKERKSI